MNHHIQLNCRKLILPFFLLFVLYNWTSRLGVDGYDLEYLLSADNLIHHGSMYMANTPDGVPGVYNRLPDQHYLPRHNLLQVFLVVPLYLAGMPFNPFFHPEESGLLALPLGSLLMVSLLNPVLTLLSVLLVMVLCIQLNFSRQIAILTGLIYGMATMAWPYSAIGMEPLQNTALLCVFWALIKFWKNKSTRDVTLLALALTALMHTKISAPLLALPISIAGLVSILREKQKRSAHLLIYCGLLMISSALWFYLYYLRSTSFYSSNFYDSFNPGLIPRNILGLILSPGKGLFAYNPILLWAILGLAATYRSNRGFVALAACVSFLTLLLTACWEWALIEECWGPRYLMPMVPLILIAGAGQFSTTRIRRYKLLFILLLLISVLVQIPGTTFPNVCMMKYAHTEYSAIVDLTTWTPDLSPIRIGWHFLANQARASLGLNMRAYTWQHYRDIVGWGARPTIAEFSDHHWNRPYSAPFLLARYLNNTSTPRNIETKDPDWLFALWSIITVVLCLLPMIWYIKFSKKSLRKNL